MPQWRRLWWTRADRVVKMLDQDGASVSMAEIGTDPAGGRPAPGGREFPEGFLWGAAIAAHQTEGGNTNSDWWWWEHQPGTSCREPSGDACDFYHRYGADIEMLAGFGLNAFRFSIEWARIEPAEGEFSPAALAHYGRMLDACHAVGVTPIVTFHHFSLPRWLHELGGFACDRFPALFERYCERAVAALGDRIGLACTINEPQGLGLSGWVLGINPPGLRGDRESAARAVRNLASAHRLGSRVIRARGVPAGVTLALPDLQYDDGAQPGESALELESRVNDLFLELARDDDFVGVQAYTRFRFGPEGPRGPGHGTTMTSVLEETDATTLMGWEFHPQALGSAIRRAHRSCPGVPILVTENGIATASDSKRVAYIEGALREVLNCRAEGIDVRGYLYWTLIDNFEWALGYAPKFGLVAVDRQSQARHPKPSAHRLGAIAREGRLDT